MAKKTKTRFAVWCRVSTDRQKDKGASFDDQRAQLGSAVKELGGKVVGEYGGSEHATPGHEKRELQRLLADAEAGAFDAVMVLDEQRWSRDIVTRREADAVLLDAGVELFNLTSRVVFTDETVLGRDFVSLIGEYQARKSKRRSMEVRIANAKKGRPSGGKLPFGRTYDRETGQWGIDPEKQKDAIEIAERYVAGESFEKLATAKGYHVATLFKSLTQQAGPEFTLSFKDESLAIDETVSVPCPALLPAETIAAMRHRAERNKKVAGKQKTHTYALGGLVRCAECGYGCSGTAEKLHRYYRHNRRNGAEECPCRPRPCPRADALEYSVLRVLLDLVKREDAIEAAIRDTIPNADEVSRLETERAKLVDDDAKKVRACDRTLGLLEDDDVDQDAVKARLAKLKRERETIAAKLAEIDRQLEASTTSADVRAAAKATAKKLRRIRSVDDPATIDPDVARRLVLDVFDGPKIEGREPGVYVTRHDDGSYSFEIVASVTLGRTVVDGVERFDAEDALGPEDYVGTDNATPSRTASPTSRG